MQIDVKKYMEIQLEHSQGKKLTKRVKIFQIIDFLMVRSAFAIAGYKNSLSIFFTSSLKNVAEI